MALNIPHLTSPPKMLKNNIHQPNQASLNLQKKTHMCISSLIIQQIQIRMLIKKKNKTHSLFVHLGLHISGEFIWWLHNKIVK